MLTKIRFSIKFKYPIIKLQFLIINNFFLVFIAGCKCSLISFIILYSFIHPFSRYWLFASSLDSKVMSPYFWLYLHCARKLIFCLMFDYLQLTIHLLCLLYRYSFGRFYSFFNCCSSHFHIFSDNLEFH